MTVPHKNDFDQWECRPVEASWKSGRVRWMEGFLAPGLTSGLSATGILLLSSVSLQHTCTQHSHVQYKHTWINHNCKHRHILHILNLRIINWVIHIKLFFDYDQLTIPVIFGHGIWKIFQCHSITWSSLFCKANQSLDSTQEDRSGSGDLLCLRTFFYEAANKDVMHYNRLLIISILIW